jgi:trehalose synthase
VIALREVDVPARPLSVLLPVIGDERYGRLVSAGADTRAVLGGRVVWNVNSTASGGGVAEMLQVLVGYTRAAGIDARWVVIEGDTAFFAITKRLHNRIHGVEGDSGALGPAEAIYYGDVTAANATALLDRVRAGDIVILHDPQTAGMVALLAEAGASIVWRCHIGADTQNSWTAEAWEFLRPLLLGSDAFVFSRRTYVPSWVPADRVAIIAPSIDPFSPKNQDISGADLPRFLARIGLVSKSPGGSAVFIRRDGSPGEVVHRATIVSDGVPFDSPGDLVVQVSRWDRLKDMRGVMVGFASGVAGRTDARLALVGPSVDGVTDDPEGAEVLAECVTAWEALPAAVRRRISLVSLPMMDIDENAAMVNAVQRAATVIVQKSLAEGFGLTVAEGMWKAKPMVASRVGGIIDQVVQGTGILLDDPTDLDAYADALVGLLSSPAVVARLGDNARRHVVDVFVGDRHLLQYANLIERLV